MQTNLCKQFCRFQNSVSFGNGFGKPLFGGFPLNFKEAFPKTEVLEKSQVSHDSK
jgi:hypothetical protein